MCDILHATSATGTWCTVYIHSTVYDPVSCSAGEFTAFIAGCSSSSWWQSKVPVTF